MSHILRCVQLTPVSLIGSVPTDGKCILTRQNRPKLKYSNNNFFSSVYATSKHMVPHNYCCLFCIIGSWEQCLNFKPWDCCYWFILAHRCAAYPCWGWRCLHHSSLCAKQNQDQDRWVAKGMRAQGQQKHWFVFQRCGRRATCWPLEHSRTRPPGKGWLTPAEVNAGRCSSWSCDAL